MPRDYKPTVGGKRDKKTEPNIRIRQAAKNIILRILCYKDTYNIITLKNRGIKQFYQKLKKDLLLKNCSRAESGAILWTYFQQYLNRAGRVVSRFKDNLPGKEFAYSFLKRHLRILSVRLGSFNCQTMFKKVAWQGDIDWGQFILTSFDTIN
ncbi:hypothetical protein JTB14_002751 [Gonioctena quinquepunctata]|nr:hypothetical protein JTB14_002751 [Gonioctena quinquepunctata]